MALALFDEDKQFVSCCLRLLCLFGASLAISVDMSALVLSQNLTLLSEIELQVEASMQEKWRSNFECVIRYLSEHPLLYFLAFDWLTNLNGRGIWDETSKGQSASQRNNENFVLLWSLHAERKKTWTMPCKRKFCDHCGEFVSERTYRRHSDLKLLNQGLSSDEDESLVRQDNKVVMDFREEQDDEREVPGTRIKSAFTKCNNVLLFLFVRLK